MKALLVFAVVLVLACAGGRGANHANAILRGKMLQPYPSPSVWFLATSAVYMFPLTTLFLALWETTAVLRTD